MNPLFECLECGHPHNFDELFSVRESEEAISFRCKECGGRRFDISTTVGDYEQAMAIPVDTARGSS